MTEAATPIDFYFDFSSPYGYIASQIVDEMEKRSGRPVKWRPTLLGVTFKIMGQVPLVEVPMKGDYARNDFARSARLHKV
ncbi:MAG TPA: DsbA family protein, partial [Usitatibacter sp.]